MAAVIRAIKENDQYFVAVDVEAYSRSALADAEAHAMAALRRRRPDLKIRSGKVIDVPAEELAQVELDKLTFVRSVTERLLAEMTGLVFGARQHDASWARIGVAINESAQTTFNRYSKLETTTRSRRHR